MYRKLISVLLGSCFALPPSAWGTIRNVSIRDNYFSPATVNVTAGDTVRWTNNGVMTHTTTSNTGVWNSGFMSPSAVFSRQFNGVGSFSYNCTIHPLMTGTVVVDSGSLDVKDQNDDNLPKSFRLEQNFPNPFNASTTITYELAYPEKATLTIYNLTGRKIRTLSEGRKSAGQHRLVWDGKDENGDTVSSGIYLYRLTVGELTRVRKMMFVK